MLELKSEESIFKLIKKDSIFIKWYFKLGRYFLIDIPVSKYDENIKTIDVRKLTENELELFIQEVYLIHNYFDVMLNKGSFELLISKVYWLNREEYSSYRKKELANKLCK